MLLNSGVVGLPNSGVMVSGPDIGCCAGAGAGFGLGAFGAAAFGGAAFGGAALGAAAFGAAGFRAGFAVRFLALFIARLTTPRLAVRFIDRLAARLRPALRAPLFFALLFRFFAIVALPPEAEAFYAALLQTQYAMQQILGDGSAIGRARAWHSVRSRGVRSRLKHEANAELYLSCRRDRRADLSE